MILVCSVLLAVVLAEVGLRLWSPVPAAMLLPFPYNGERLRRIVEGNVSLGFDPFLGWVPSADQVRRDAGVVYRNNHQTLRADREYDQTPPIGLWRIAAFGDSFTYCAEVTQADCWTHQLERAWPQTEILNFGVVGYGPDQAWLRYQRDGRPYSPCAVLIGYFSEDIDRVVNRFRPFIDPNDSVVLSKPRFLLDGAGLRLLPNPIADPLELRDPGYVERVLGEHDAWYFPNTFTRSPFDSLSLIRVARTAAYRESRLSLVRRDGSYPFYDEQGEAFQITGRILIEFAAQVRADGATPIVIIFPGKKDLPTMLGARPPYLTLGAWLQRAGVLTIDLTELMTENMRQRGIDQLFMERHYSGLGNRIVSEELAHTLPSMVSSTCQPR